MSSITSLKSCSTKVGQQEAVVQLGAPAHQALRRVGFPRSGQQAAQQELLGQRHARVGGISKARISTRPRRPVGPSGE